MTQLVPATDALTRCTSAIWCAAYMVSTIGAGDNNNWPNVGVAW